MNKVIIFGIKDFAELAHFYLTTDSAYEVVAFTVDQDFIEDKTHFHGLPIIPFETVEDVYSPDEYLFFAPVSSKKMNKIRENIYVRAKEKGYSFITYISSKATLFDNEIGENCFILENNTIQPFTKIGNNVVLWSGNHIGHHGEIKDHVFFTSHVVMSGHCIIESHSFLGVNATLRDNLVIAKGSLVAMGASITKNTEEWQVYVGNPAKKIGKRSDEIDF